MVLFTFVVMLLNAGREERTLGSRAAVPSAFPQWLPFSAVIATVILAHRASASRLIDDPITPTEELSRVLFHELLLPFEVTSILILIAILGAVAASARTPADGERTGQMIPSP